jgi:hypothetical protein
MRPGTAGDRVIVVREALARFDTDSLDLGFVANEIVEANGDVIVVGRVQEWRDGDLSREISITLLWEFENDDLLRIEKLASKSAALGVARCRQARYRQPPRSNRP